jgi:phage-related protein
LSKCIHSDTFSVVRLAHPVKLSVRFYATAAGAEPVRAWLRTLPAEERKIIGEDIKTVQFGWPLGMPVVRKLAPKLWEVRSVLRNRIARVLFTVKGEQMVLLHGFIKKAQRTPAGDLRLALSRIDF